MSSSTSDSDPGQQFLDATGVRPIWVISAVLALIVVVAAVVAIRSQREAKAHAANNALYEAQKSLDQETKAFVASVAPPQAPAQDKKKAAAPEKKTPAENPEALMFRKTDVDAHFGEAIQKFKTVVDQYPGTRAAFEANLSIGGLYSNHGEPAKAVSWFEKAADSAPGSFDKALAFSSLGYAQEGAGKYNEAIQAYQKAMNVGEAALKGDLLLSIARNYELMGDKAKARSTYEQIIGQMPNTEQARSADLLKAQLQ